MKNAYNYKTKKTRKYIHICAYITHTQNYLIKSSHEVSLSQHIGLVGV